MLLSPLKSAGGSDNINGYCIQFGWASKAAVLYKSIGRNVFKVSSVLQLTDLKFFSNKTFFSSKYTAWLTFKFHRIHGEAGLCLLARKVGREAI